jgi:protein-S-isoprenylcysteine O-methyltransferase Ste14
MDMPYRWLFEVPWVLFMAYWWWASRRAATAARKETLAERMTYQGLIWLGAALFAFDRLGIGPRGWHVLPAAPETFILGLGLVIAGLLFAVWARVHLGRNWSGTVAIKIDHELIRSGPYRIVRHPIYTGILLGMLGVAIGLGEIRGLVALVLFVVAFEIKLHREEAWLTQQFGAAYRAYRHDVKGLVPFVW